VFGRKAKIRKAVARALETVRDESGVADHAPIEALPAALHLQAYYTLVLALQEDELYVAARHTLLRAIELAPDSPELQALRASIASEVGELDDAIAAQRRAVAAAPKDVNAVLALTDLLLTAERVDEALELLQPRRGDDAELDAKLGEVLFVHGDNEQAFALLDEVCNLYYAQLKQGLAVDFQALKTRYEHVDRLRQDVYAEMHGREATIELAAAEGKLDARAGVNYKLLGARLATKSGRIAEELALESPDATAARGERLLARSRGHGLSLIGCAQLRRGELTDARKTFERACEADGRCFPAFLGLGAVIDAERHELSRLVARLAQPASVSPALSAVVPDYAALTQLERRVVVASAQPLAALLPKLAEQGVTMKILPIDVRATDLGLFEDASGERADDHRSYDAISGVATHGGAVAKIEELLDVTETGWTFAHELAHLAFFHMPDEQSAAWLELYDRACEVGYANIDYALSNADEFFAVSYAEYLCHRHEVHGRHEADDAGIRAALMTKFDELAKSAR
jgi:tetratricopeptide (TPR) repeat protein